MGRLIATELQPSGFFDGIDYLVPVPLHPARLRQRGYNQSELLCNGISELTAIPLVTDALVRIHNNTTQTHKSGSERWQNTQGLFKPTEQAAKLRNKHVLFCRRRLYYRSHSFRLYHSFVNCRKHSGKCGYAGVCKMILKANYLTKY